MNTFRGKSCLFIVSLIWVLSSMLFAQSKSSGELTGIAQETVDELQFQLDIDEHFTVVPPEGEVIHVIMACANLSETEQASDVWFVMHGPQGQSHQIRGVYLEVMAPGAVKFRNPREFIPASAPAGEYFVVMLWGAPHSFQSDTVGTDTVWFQKVAGELAVGAHSGAITPGLSDDSPAVESVVLHGNYPNPFNPETSIRFYLPGESHVQLLVYDMLGRQVRALVNQTLMAGNQQIEWNGQSDSGVRVASGTYIYQLRVGTEVLSGRMLLTQ